MGMLRDKAGRKEHAAEVSTSTGEEKIVTCLKNQELEAAAHSSIIEAPSLPVLGKGSEGREYKTTGTRGDNEACDLDGAGRSRSDTSDNVRAKVPRQAPRIQLTALPGDATHRIARVLDDRGACDVT